MLAPWSWGSRSGDLAHSPCGRQAAGVQGISLHSSRAQRARPTRQTGRRVDRVTQRSKMAFAPQPTMATLRRPGVWPPPPNRGETETTMDDARFDAFTRAFTISRRTTGKTLLGAGLGLLLAGRRRDAAADCKKVGQGCDRSDDCCKDAKCRRGECKCKNGFTDCSGRCKNLNNNENHCGGCDDACPRPPTTPNPHTCCSGTCRNLPTDENHCGACNAECPIGTYCDDGIGGILCRCFEPMPHVSLMKRAAPEAASTCRTTRTTAAAATTPAPTLKSAPTGVVCSARPARSRAATSVACARRGFPFRVVPTRAQGLRVSAVLGERGH